MVALVDGARLGHVEQAPIRRMDKSLRIYILRISALIPRFYREHFLAAVCFQDFAGLTRRGGITVMLV